ncbi:MAG: hypothetical protein L6Q35_12850, partial [Phycisphaerales bacterium]|nr:hypothetical protein [Phycisphaerales bacterium]
MGAFTVTLPGLANLETKLIMPSSVGRRNLATVYVEYANTGTVAMPAPFLRVESADPDGSDRPVMTLDQSLLGSGFWVDGMPDGFSESLQMLGSGASPGLLLPGERVQVPVYYTGLQKDWD